MKTIVTIGIGSNISYLNTNSFNIIKNCIEYLDYFPIKIQKYSSIYITPPVDNTNQPNFFNSIILIKTYLYPNILLKLLQTIEKEFGRIKNKNKKWLPRTLDLDIIDYKNLLYNSKTLKLPHPEIKNRKFVTFPLYEINHNWQDPRNGLYLEYYINNNCNDFIIKLV